MMDLQVAVWIVAMMTGCYLIGRYSPFNGKITFVLWVTFMVVMAVIGGEVIQWN